MVDIVEIFLSIIPFIFSIGAIALIPSKEKIERGEKTTFKPETHVAVYLIALFPLSMGVYFSMPLFSTGSGNIFIYLINAALLVIIGIGIMGLNYRNYSLFSEKNPTTAVSSGTMIEQRVSGDPVINENVVEAIEVNEVEPISYQQESRVEGKITRLQTQPKKPLGQAKPQMVECPQCKAAIKVDMSQRPVKLSCPRCGIEGMVQ
jgi:hypothetical protein